MTNWNELQTCPRCRGYWLERQWCALCNGNGLVKLDRRDAAAHVFSLLRERK